MQAQAKQVPGSASAAASLGAVPCWSCKGPVSEGAPFCPVCETVQPPGQLDHFSRLGLEARFDIDERVLERRYFDLQKRLHPDCFATRAPSERALSQQQATSLNEAYSTLKEPLKRADYLVHLKGAEVLPEGCHLVNDTELLEESMELREALAEAEGVADVELLERRAADDIETCIRQLSALFAADDLEGACRLTTRLKYLGKLAEEARLRRAQLV